MYHVIRGKPQLCVDKQCYNLLCVFSIFCAMQPALCIPAELQSGWQSGMFVSESLLECFNWLKAFKDKVVKEKKYFELE